MKRRSGALVLALALLAAACHREPGRPIPSADVDDSAPRTGGTLVRRLESPIRTLNPVLVGSRYETYLHRYLFTPLVDLSADLQPIPGLADKWDISADKREYTFHLNPSATFSDRTPVRASDVLFTIAKVNDPQSDALAVASYFDQLNLPACRVVDDHTIVIAFREPLASQLIAFTNLMIIPEHVYAQGSFTKDHNTTAVGSGAYTLAGPLSGGDIVLTRRRDYWRANPYIDTVRFKVIQSDTTGWNAARVGEVDETPIQSEVWLREQTNPQVKRRLEFVQYYGLAYNCIIWNTRLPQLGEKRIRRALAMCLNLQAIIAGMYHGTARVMNGHFVPEVPGFNPTVQPVAFDLTGAKQILTSLGWLDTNGDGILDKEGKPLAIELLIPTGSASALAVAQLYQADLAKVGVTLQISVVDFAATQQRLTNGNFEAAYLSWDLDADPDPYQLFHSTQAPPHGQNFSFYASAEADRLIEAGRREFDPAKRVALYQQLHAVLAEDQPFAWIDQPTVKWVVNRRVRGVKLGDGYGLFLWSPGELGWWLADATTARTGT